MTRTFRSKYTGNHRASASAEARFACANTRKNSAALILDAIIMASIIIILITLALVLNLRLVLGLVSLILAVRLTGCEENPCRSRQIP